MYIYCTYIYIYISLIEAKLRDAYRQDIEHINVEIYIKYIYVSKIWNKQNLRATKVPKEIQCF